MKKEETPWSSGVLMICTKCHKSIDSSKLKEEGNCGENLKMDLKGRFKKADQGHKIRVVTSSCLDVCIDNEQAVAFAPVQGPTQTFIMHPEKDRDELFHWLEERI